MPDDSQAPKVRGRGAARFGSAFGGSGLLAWTSDDTHSPPSQLALNPRRSSRSRSPRRAGAAQEEKRKVARTKRDELLDGPLEPEKGDGGEWKKQWREPKPKREPRSKWVKVDNIPKFARSQHIRYLFSSPDAKVQECILDGGKAYVRFERYEHAAYAVSNFNGGDINGEKIQVELEFTPPQSAEQPPKEKEDGAKDAAEAAKSGEKKKPAAAEAAAPKGEEVADDSDSNDSDDSSDDEATPAKKAAAMPPAERRVVQIIS